MSSTHPSGPASKALVARLTAAKHHAATVKALGEVFGYSELIALADAADAHRQTLQLVDKRYMVSGTIGTDIDRLAINATLLRDAAVARARR